MKVHVTLRDEFRRDPGAKKLAFDRIVQSSGIHGVNEKRFERYGIISGDLDDETHIEAIQKLAEVDSVEADREQFAI